MMKPLPDWTTPARVILAMPGSRQSPKDRTDIIRDYALFLRKHDIPVTVLINKITKSKILEAFTEQSVETLDIKAGDIWIRDWAPLLCERDGKLVAVKFKYPHTYPYSPRLDNKAGRELAERLGIELIESDIIWELGNFTTNGKDIIVTDQVLKANHLKRPETLRNRLVDKLGFDPKIRIHVLPVLEQDSMVWKLHGLDIRDTICHIDGYMRFIDTRKIVWWKPLMGSLGQAIWRIKCGFLLKPDERKLSFWESYYLKERKMISLAYWLLRQGKKMFPLECMVTMDKFYDKVTENETITDFGDYINFLRFGNKVFVPQYYPRPNDRESAALSVYQKAGAEVIPVREPIVNKLAMAGGVLNCAAWVVYKV